MDKEEVVYKYIYKGMLAIKGMKFAICNSIYGPGGIMLSEIYQTEKDKYCMFSVLCGI